MNNRVIRHAAVLTAVFMMIFSICAYAKTDIPEPTERLYVNDYANVLDKETENYIFEKSKAYSADGGPQVAVLTMKSIGETSLEEFSIDTARKWGIGGDKDNNGVLILLVMDSRDIRIEVGYGLEGVLNDGKCGRFIRNASSALSSGDYSGGIKQIYDSVIGELEKPANEGNVAVTLFTAVLIIALWIIASRRGGGHYRRGGYYRGYGPGSFGGFGGFGGGFSGGGGSFGGGSFGGGGASGKF